MKHSRSGVYPSITLASAAPDLLSRDRPSLLALPPGEVFDCLHTFRCGQLFRWREHAGAWYGPFGAASLRVKPVPGGLEVRAQGAPVTVREVRTFLALDVSLQSLDERLAGDPWVSTAIRALPGLRILRQDPWECLVNFICSQNSNIPKIELSTERLARRWGAVHQWDDDVEVAVLPAPEVLSEVETDALRPCGLGYRCRYLTACAQRVAVGQPQLAELRAVPYTVGLNVLLTLPGIGRKVADCVLLFCLDKPQACPVDVWVRRIIHELYPRALLRRLPDAVERAEKALTSREYDAIQSFAWDRWGMLAGYAQQYLFHARRLGLIGV